MPPRSTHDTSNFSVRLGLRCPRKRCELPRTSLYIPALNHSPPSNHSNFVAQKQAAVTCSVSSTLARIADAEWGRYCENVRKSSPHIGNLGEWRSLCDGGWVGKVPDDLPDIDTVTTGPSLAPLPAVEEELNSDTDLRVTRATATNTNRDTSPNLSPVLPPLTTDPDLPQRDPMTVKSDVPALDHFPAPPVHFPLPHLQRVSTNTLDGPAVNPPSYGRRVTSLVSPVQGPPDSTATIPTELAATTATHPSPPVPNTWADTPIYLHTPSRSDPNQPSSLVDSSTTILTADDTEFGIRQPRPLPSSGSPGSYSLPKGSPQSSGVVLAMRNRFAQNVGCDRYTCAIRGLNFIVYIFSSTKRFYDFDPSSTGQCVNHHRSLPTRW